MRRTLALGILVLAAAAGALALRLPALGERPMHGDEAVHAVKLGALLEKGEYRYDPNEFHGPSLYYLTLPVTWMGGVKDLAGAAEWHLRLVPVIFGVGLVLVVWLLRDGLGWAASVAAAVLTAISPAMVFYSRYYIHETLLVVFTAMAVAAGWRYARSGRLGWAIVGGVGLGLMYATKETCVFAFAAMGVALVVMGVWSWRGDACVAPLRAGLRLFHLVVALGVGVAVSLVLFSSFFTNAAGVGDSVRAYIPWLGRSGHDSVHNHPWHYYLGLLTWSHAGPGPVWTEALILVLGLAGMVAAFTGKGVGKASVPLLRFLGLYTLLLTAIYSAVPYKTPWCLLGFWHGMILLAGVGAVAVVRMAPRGVAKGAIVLLLAVGGGHLVYQAMLATGNRYHADPRNPYVYAHPVGDVVKMAGLVEGVAAVDAEGRRMRVQVIATGADYWPLPWYLRGLERAGYWQEVPERVDAPVVVVSEDLQERVKAKLGGRYGGEASFGLRPDVRVLVYVRGDLWERFVARRAVSGMRGR